jgi:hypothetical protein
MLESSLHRIFFNLVLYLYMTLKQAFSLQVVTTLQLCERYFLQEQKYHRDLVMYIM